MSVFTNLNSEFSAEDTGAAIAVLRDTREKFFGPLCWQYENDVQGHEGVVVSAFVIDKPAQQIAVLCANSDRTWTKSVIAQGWEIPLKTLIENIADQGV